MSRGTSEGGKTQKAGLSWNALRMATRLLSAKSSRACEQPGRHFKAAASCPRRMARHRLGVLLGADHQMQKDATAFDGIAPAASVGSRLPPAPSVFGKHFAFQPFLAVASSLGSKSKSSTPVPVAVDKLRLQERACTC